MQWAGRLGRRGAAGGLIGLVALVCWAAAPAQAGRAIMTGHDADLHCNTGLTPASDQCHYLRIAVDWVRGGAPDPSRPVLVLDRGPLQAVRALDKAYGIMAATAGVRRGAGEAVAAVNHLGTRADGVERPRHERTRRREDLLEHRRVEEPPDEWAVGEDGQRPARRAVVRRDSAVHLDRFRDREIETACGRGHQDAEQIGVVQRVDRDVTEPSEAFGRLGFGGEERSDGANTLERGCVCGGRHRWAATSAIAASARPRTSATAVSSITVDSTSSPRAGK